MPASTEEALNKAASLRTLRKFSLESFHFGMQSDHDSAWQFQNAQEPQSWAGHLLCSQRGPAEMREERCPRSQNQVFAGTDVTTEEVLRTSHVSLDASGAVLPSVSSMESSSLGF